MIHWQLSKRNGRLSGGTSWGVYLGKEDAAGIKATGSRSGYALFRDESTQKRRRAAAIPNVLRRICLINKSSRH